MSERLEEMLRIAQAATPGPWRVEKDTNLVWGACDPDDQSSNGMGYAIAPCYTLAASYAKGPTEYEGLANAQHIATFNPRTAEALVKGMQVLEEIQRAASRNTGPLARDNHMDRFHSIGFRAAEALSALTAAMEDSSNVG